MAVAASGEVASPSRSAHDVAGLLALAMPAWRRGQKLGYSFDEDEWTLAWDALRGARLPAGTKVAARGFEKPLPAWFWTGIGLVADDAAPTTVTAVPTTAGPSVAVSLGPAPDIDGAARRLLEMRPARPEAEWMRHRAARDLADTEADFPLGAYVLQSRHDEVTAARMALPAGKVASWTTIGPGAAPTEFARLQEAIGAYHVGLVALPDGSRTVGIWTGTLPPATGAAAQPVLRRLFRTQAGWRHGVKFAPVDG